MTIMQKITDAAMKKEMKNTPGDSVKGNDAMIKSDHTLRMVRSRWIICLFAFCALVITASLSHAGAPPSISIDDPVSSQTINSVPYTVSGTCSGGSGTYTSITFDDGSGPVSVGTVGAWTHSWSPADATYTLNASCTDDAAKTGNATAVTGVVVSTCVDSDIATMTISDPIESATIGGLYTVYGQVGTESAPLTMGTVQFSLNGGAWTNATGNNGSDSFTISWDTTLEADGPATIQVRGYDPDCGGTNLITSAVRNVTINNACSDTDIAAWTITTPTESATVSGSAYTITARVDTETAPLTMGTVEFNLNGAGWSSVGVTDNGVDSFTIDWDTTLEADGPATIQVRGFDPDCGGTNLVTSGVRNVDVNNSGPSNTLTSCAGCHDYPPTDGTRDGATGAFVGDHAKHNAYTCNFCHTVPGTETSADFAHRDGSIDTKSGTIGMSDASDNGSYSRGASFAQSNSPTGGTCANVNCHANNPSPQWGVGNTACDTCHALPPATSNFAHDAHYTAKGWTAGVETNCTACHPDNTIAHSDVTDNSVLVNAGLTPAGSTPAITCASTGTGCHNGNTSLAWNVAPATITCTDCHTVGGSNTATVANPASGLHGNATASVQDHDNTLTGGCEACHVKGSISGHWDGTASATADYTKAAVGITAAMYTDAGGTAATRGSCLSNTDLAACHTDGGEWRRAWSTDADADIVASPLPGQAVCNVCHGQYSTLTASTGWNEGTVHYRSGSGAAEDKGATAHIDAGDECEDCHGYDSAATHNGNNAIDFSDLGGEYTITLNTAPNPDLWYCATCHDSHNTEDPTLTSTHTYLDSLAFPNSVAHVTGTSVPEGGCSTCHGGATTGANADSYWPDSAVKNIDNGGSADDEGAHVTHMTVIARRLYNLTLTGLLDDASSDTKQKAICDYCHQGSTNDGDHMTGDDAEVFPVGYRLTLSGAADGGTAASYTTGTCSTTDCHNEQSTSTTYDWYSGATSTCTMCHTPGGAGNDPNSGLHTGSAPTISAQKHDDTLAGGCAACHTMDDLTAVQGSTHVNNAFTGNGSVAGDRTAMGLTGDYTTSGIDNTGTCATTCHSGAGDNGTWARKWDSAIHYDPLTAGEYTECAGCHGGFAGDWAFGTDNVDADGSVSHDRDWDGDTTAAEVIGSHPDGTAKCKSCHGFGYAGVYDVATFATHRDGKITFNDEMGYSSASKDCTTYCHSDNTGHNLESSGWSTVSNTVNCPPLACGDCHATAASGSAGVGTDSPHVTVGKAGGYNTFVDCTECHSGHADGTTGANDVEISTAGISFNAKYAGHGGGAIQLGGARTTGSNEAEICWNCHSNDTYQGAPDISEWDGSSAIYDYGGVTANNLNWLTTSWTSANFSYKDGGLTTALGSSASTHGVMGGAAGVDAIGAIGCSACHDVHDTGGGTNDGTAPYLRGTWKSSPYYEDGAPGEYTGTGGSGTSTYLDGSTYGIVPRSSAAITNGMGGFWIDQNSGSPANGTYATHAGLCTLCHGDGDAIEAEAADVTAIETAWGGHTNTVAGGSHNGTNNIFSNTIRIGNGVWNGLNAGPYMGNQSVVTFRSSDYGGTIRTDDYGDGVAPIIAGKSRPFETFQWAGLSVDDNTVNASFHNFSCSKCHNPHASRLPKLMITNCLDVTHNTWDNAFTGDTNWNANNFASMTYNTKELAYASSAQNCHRYVPAQETGGWNAVTPW